MRGYVARDFVRTWWQYALSGLLLAFMFIACVALIVGIAERI